MSLILKFTAFAFSIYSVTASAAEALKIDIPNKALTISFSAPVRLNTLLDELNKQGVGGYFPLAAQLYNVSETSALNHKKEQLFSDLEVYSKVNKEAGWVLEQLKNELFLPRQFVTLDRNVVISQFKSNALLSGQYSLYLPDRKDSVSIFGVIQKAETMPWVEHRDFSSYLETLPESALGDSADSSLAYAIQPDGHVIEVPYAYWNYSPKYFAPGAIFFLGFSSLPSEHATLNQDIVELLRHKVNL